MPWAGSNILYIINQEMLCPEGELGARRFSGSYSQCVSGLSRFDVEGLLAHRGISSPGFGEE
jgi:hypothetical protein